MNPDLVSKICLLENEYIRIAHFIELLKNMHEQNRLISENSIELDQIRNEIETLKIQQTTMGKLKMKKLVLVESISQHLIRRCVEVKDDIDYALDSFDAEELDDREMSQTWLGEISISHREITEYEYLKIFDKDNEYLKDWDKEQKLDMIHRIKSDD